MLRRSFLCALGGLAMLLVLTGCGSTGGASSGAGKVAPPESYLQTGASVAVVDFFDMYCHRCQTAASHVNDLYAAVQDRGQGGKVQFYAVGWGNTPLEAQKYQARFKVPFPVIADRELAISQRYGKFRPPMIIVLERRGGNWVEVHRSHDLRDNTSAVLAHINP